MIQTHYNERVCSYSKYETRQVLFTDDGDWDWLIFKRFFMTKFVAILGFPLTLYYPYDIWTIYEANYLFLVC